MSKGPGRIERSIVKLLASNDHVDAKTLAAYVYQDMLPTKPVITKAQYSSVRRVLSRLQKKGAVIKFRCIFYGERYSYANKENAFTLLQRMVKSLGHYPVFDHPDLLAFYKEEAFLRMVLDFEGRTAVHPV